MLPMTPQREAEARKMVSDEERDQIVSLAGDIERLINARLKLGLSGQQVGAIASAVRAEYRANVDAAIHHQRSTAYRGTPAL